MPKDTHPTLPAGPELVLPDRVTVATAPSPAASPSAAAADGRPAAGGAGSDGHIDVSAGSTDPFKREETAR